MKSIRYLLVALIAGGALGACADAPLPVADTASELSSLAPRLIQPGANLMLLAVTDDDHAIYQDGQTVFASKLAAGASRSFVANVPEGNIAFPLQVGKVVFVWTAPQRNLPGFGVSPLVLWTSERGPLTISSQSAVGLVATAASSDSRQILFTTHVTADGLRGDLAHARIRDALSPTILLRDTPLDFPSGRCRPLAGFAGSNGDEFPIAAYCAGTDSTATLSTWDRGIKRDLISGIATPLRFFFGGDPQGRTFLVSLADTTVATVTTSGRVTVLDSAPLASAGFITRRGTVGYIAAPPGQSRELRVALRGHPPVTSVSTTLGQPVELYNRSGYSIRHTTSPDGALSLFTSAADPATGLTDVVLLDTGTGRATVVDPRTRSAFGSELYTSDSKFALYFDVPEPSTFAGALFAANRSGSHQIGTSGAVFDVLRAAGSVVSYSDNPIFDPAREFFASTADLVVADTDDSCPPRLVSAAAGLFYFPTGDRHRLVFTSENEAGGPGLYLASARVH